MSSWKLGNDVYLEFTCRVGKGPCLISRVAGKLYRDDEYLRDFRATHSGDTISCVILGDTFTTVGDYIAKFEVWLGSMGKREHAIPFTITRSVLGKKRQRGAGNINPFPMMEVENG